MVGSHQLTQPLETLQLPKDEGGCNVINMHINNDQTYHKNVFKYVKIRMQEFDLEATRNYEIPNQPYHIQFFTLNNAIIL